MLNKLNIFLDFGTLTLIARNTVIRNIVKSTICNVIKSLPWEMIFIPVFSQQMS